MSLHLGRLTLPEPTLWVSTGATHVQVTGSYKASSLTDGMTRRDQLLGLADDQDIPIIPVTRDAETRVNGYYRVLGVTISTDEFALKQGNLYDYRVDLQSVQGFTQPWLECIVSGALLTNVVGAVLADVQGFHAVPAAASEYQSPTGAVNYSPRTSADGVMNFNIVAGGGLSGTGRYAIPPASFYVGAATFEQGSPLLPVVGRMMVQPDIVNWRLSNGLVRVTPNAAIGKINVSHYNGTTWSAIKTYLLSSTGTPAASFNTLTVLRNSVEEVTIRLSFAGIGGTAIATMDLSLRRGDRIVRCYVTSTASANWKLARDTSEAATAITYGAVTAGGIRATNNDGDGNRYVLLCYQNPGGAAQTQSDLVVGSIVESFTELTADFGIGSEIGGSAAVSPHDAVSIAKQYLAAQSESQRAVAR